MERQDIEKQLSELKKILAKKKRKLKKCERRDVAKAHVKRKLEEQAKYAETQNKEDTKCVQTIKCSKVRFENKTNILDIHEHTLANKYDPETDLKQKDGSKQRGNNSETHAKQLDLSENSTENTSNKVSLLDDVLRKANVSYNVKTSKDTFISHGTRSEENNETTNVILSGIIIPKSDAKNLKCAKYTDITPAETCNPSDVVTDITILSSQEDINQQDVAFIQDSEPMFSDEEINQTLKHTAVQIKQVERVQNNIDMIKKDNAVLMSYSNDHHHKKQHDSFAKCDLKYGHSPEEVIVSTDNVKKSNPNTPLQKNDSNCKLTDTGNEQSQKATNLKTLRQETKKGKARKSEFSVLDFSFLEDDSSDLYSQIKKRKRKTQSVPYYKSANFISQSCLQSQDFELKKYSIGSESSEVLSEGILKNEDTCKPALVEMPKCAMGLSQYPQADIKTKKHDAPELAANISEKKTPVTTKQARNISESSPVKTKQAKNISESSSVTTKQARNISESSPVTTKQAKNISESSPVKTKQARNISESSPVTTKQGRNISESSPVTTEKAKVVTVSGPTNNAPIIAIKCVNPENSNKGLVHKISDKTEEVFCKRTKGPKSKSKISKNKISNQKAIINFPGVPSEASSHEEFDLPLKHYGELVQLKLSEDMTQNSEFYELSQSLLSPVHNMKDGNSKKRISRSNSRNSKDTVSTRCTSSEYESKSVEMLNSEESKLMSRSLSQVSDSSGPHRKISSSSSRNRRKRKVNRRQKCEFSEDLESDSTLCSTQDGNVTKENLKSCAYQSEGQCHGAPLVPVYSQKSIEKEIASQEFSEEKKAFKGFVKYKSLEMSDEITGLDTVNASNGTEIILVALKHEYCIYNVEKCGELSKICEEQLTEAEVILRVCLVKSVYEGKLAVALEVEEEKHFLLKLCIYQNWIKVDSFDLDHWDNCKELMLERGNGFDIIAAETSTDGTILTRYNIDRIDENKVSTVHFDKPSEYIHSFKLIQNLEEAIAALSEQSLYIWNYNNGRLLLEISLAVTCVLCPSVYHEEGLLFMPVLPCYQNKWSLLAVNPSTKASCEVMSYTGNNSDFDKSDCSTCIAKELSCCTQNHLCTVNGNEKRIEIFEMQTGMMLYQETQLMEERPSAKILLKSINTLNGFMCVQDNIVYTYKCSYEC